MINFIFKILVKNEEIFLDLLKLFIPFLSLKIWQDYTLDVKLDLIKKLIDYRQKEIENFENFYKKMNVILSFISRPELSAFGKFKHFKYTK